MDLLVTTSIFAQLNLQQFTSYVQVLTWVVLATQGRNQTLSPQQVSTP
jgi:hypothetical protein